ncbi:MAG: hypothetical protein Q9225_005406, partial [Loekoesia sp. 1 TL-2023]
MSSAMVVSMAVEAARQLWISEISNDLANLAIQLTNVKTLRILPLATRVDKPQPLEVQFVSKMETGPARISFEVHCNSDGATNTWDLFSTGVLELLPKMPSVPQDSTLKVSDDPVLLQKAQTLHPHLFSRFEGLRMRSSKLCGYAAEAPESFCQYPIHPAILGPLLSLGPMCMLDQNLPVKYRIASIETLQVCVNAKGPSPMAFNVTTKPAGAGRATSKVAIRRGAEILLTSEIRYAATELIPPTYSTSSLFFKPVSLPDVTKQIDATRISIQRLIELLTHKWPMCDVAIGDVSAEAQDRILEALGIRKPGKSQRFRSITTCQKVEHDMNNDRIQIVEELPSGLEASLIFAGATFPAQTLRQYLQASGLACICGSMEQLDQQVSEPFEYIGQVTGLDEAIWTLWRKRNTIHSSPVKRQRFIFSTGHTPAKAELRFDLRPPEIKAFVTRHDNERFDAILIDDPQRSIILHWPGEDLIPWLRYLMKHAESLLWVATDISSSPFVNVAGTLLRTLQAEQPSLKVCWLVLDKANIEEAVFTKKIDDAYDSMLQGDNEIRLGISETETEIIRYLPDEDLSLATGVSLPRQVQDPIGDRDYVLALAASNEPVVLSYDSDVPAASRYLCLDDSENISSPQSKKEIKVESGRVKVIVLASMIDGDDLTAYEGRFHDRWCHDSEDPDNSSALGTLFAGKVLASSASRCSQGSSVVGWTNGAHANIVVDVPEKHLYLAAGNDRSQSLAEFASLATAMAVVDGHIRVRKDDHLEFVNVDGILHEAFMMACQYLQVAISECQKPHSPTFKIEVSDCKEILVNGMPVDNATGYLGTRPSAFEELWKTHGEFTSSAQCFSFKDNIEAFASADIYTHPTILIHGDAQDMPHVPIYRPPTHLASTKGAYIIVGGLGGLGRYVCSWLVEQGATSLYAISRSGISSPEAQHLHDTLNSTPGVSLQVIKADACDRSLMSSTLSSIRARGEPIKGVINMAMILGDAPLASMTPEEWDRALRVKIDSSWILHELTLQDDLDTFILFSSIASVLGNRGQGSYNVGNAFLNALASWRRTKGKTAVAIALGAMTDIGVLASLPSSFSHSSAQTIATNLARSGLSRLTSPHLAKILEAAFRKSRWQHEGRELRPEDALIVTGLEMLEKERDGSLV